MVADHSTIAFMDEIAVSKFKATCLAALDRVHRTGRPLRVTRFGRPLADVVPPQPAPRVDSWVGAMRGTGRLTDDVVATADRAIRSKHPDPVDRFLTATAQVFDMTLVTADAQVLAMKGFAVLPNRTRAAR